MASTVSTANMESTVKTMTKNNERINVTALLLDLLRVLRKMWINVVALVVICAVGFGAYAHFTYVPQYTAYTSFTVNIWDEESESGIAAYYDNAAAEQMASSFPYILTSGVLQRMIAEDMGSDGVSGTINASVVENTNLFTLSVTDTDPERAEKTLEAVIKNYPQVSESVIGKVNMNVLDESGVPEAPDGSADIKGNAVKGAVAGFAIGFAWVVLVALMRKTIRSEEDCQKYINQRCLGSVPLVKIKERSNKSKSLLNITKRNVDPNFKEAVRIVRNKVERYTKEGSMKRILVTSALSGEGKSTLAVNLAISLAQEGKSVTLIDCDLRNPSDAEIMDVTPEKGLIDFLKGEAELKDCLLLSKNMYLNGEKSRLVFIPGGKAVADGSNLLGSDKMKEVLDMVNNSSEYIILDSAPVGLLTDASELAQFADCAMFVVKKDHAKAEHIMSGIEHLAESSIPVIGCVLNGD